MAVCIQGVASGSPAETAGVKPGMNLVSVDGHTINDGLDYEFYTSPAKLTLMVGNAGQEQQVVVHKEEYEPLGCEFGSYLIDKQHSCKNGCVFCFIDQLPPHMRSSLYFKDDDERLSFLFGNYVSLTNLTDKEVDRIIQMRISPINISVHTTNPELRVQMMKNKHSGEVLRYIPKLAAANIPMNCQLVLCPGLNDGDELKHSIEWLAQYRPAIQSLAAVPVGLTGHREGLCPLQAYTQQTAAEQLDIMLAYGDQFQRETGTRFVYPSDEWFLLAGRPIPEESFYDGYPQLENGVGMWRLLWEEFTAALSNLGPEDRKLALKADIATGTSAAPLLGLLAKQLMEAMPNAQVRVHAIQNIFFGGGVTVVGLLTGQDIIRQLQGKVDSGRLLLSENMLRAEGDILLDGLSPQDIETQLDAQVTMVAQTGEALLEALLAQSAE